VPVVDEAVTRSCRRKGSGAGIQPKRGSLTEPHSIMCLMATKSPERAASTNRNWNRIAVAAHYRDPAPSCRPPPALSATEGEKLLQLTSHVALPAAAPLTPAPQRSRPLAPLNLFFLLFDGFDLFLKSNLHCAFQPLLMMRIGIITCGVVPDELVPQYGT
jgi:hypothetical protein